MAAKPIKSLELHYTMIQFLINMFNLRHWKEILFYATDNLNFLVNFSKVVFDLCAENRTLGKCNVLVKYL